MIKGISKVLILLGMILFFGCQDSTTDTPVEIAEPTLMVSGEPNLCCTQNSTPAMSWIEESDGQSVLKWAAWEGGNWSNRMDVAEGDDWFVNWADFPMMCHGEDGLVATNYLKKSGEGTYSYDVVLRLSQDGGMTWGDELIPHLDGAEAEHGFVSIIPYQDHLMAMWLDGRKYGSGIEEMTLRAAEIDRDGTILNSYLIDDRVCDCCPTSAVNTANGPMVVYRDRSENEIRDIGVSRFNGESWSSPEILFADEWEISGCPVNGPAIDSKDQTVVVAWYTGANESQQVKARISLDGGEKFGETILVKGSGTVGRVDAVALSEGEALVSWLDESVEESSIKYCRITHEGATGLAQTVAISSSERASGFPKMIQSGDSLLFAWTETGESRKVASKWVQMIENELVK
jgi:hypothetical protein